MRVQIAAIRQRLHGADADERTAVIATRPGGYSLELAPHQIDLHRFRSLVHQGGGLLQDGSADRAGDRYREALALWREPPLPDLGDLDDAAPLRAEVESLALAAHEGVLLCRLEMGQNQALLAELEPLLVREPLREELYAMAMLALYREGRQADALEMYQRARTALVGELGIEPSERLRELELAILEQRSDLAATDESAVGATTTASFVGRSRELVALGDAWHQAQAGRGSIALVTGDPGVGKTRLAREVVDQVRSDATAAWGSCAAVGRAAPFGVVTSCFAQLAALDDEAAALVGEARRRASEVLDEGGAELQVGGGAYQRLVDELLVALRRLAARRPLLLVLDDLHEVDHASAGFLVQLGQVIGEIPALVLATARSADADAGAALADALPQLLRLDAVVHRTLAPLDRAETERYLSTILGDATHPDVVDAIWSRAAGNLLFTVELAELVHRTDGQVLPSPPLPEALRQYVRARVADLPPAEADALEVASVLGAEFPASLVHLVLDDPSATNSLGALVDRRLLAPSGGGSFRFAHELVREAIVGELGHDRRIAIHGRCAEVLEQQALADADLLGDAARHRRAALPDAPEACIDACLAAATHAVGVAGFADAAAWCDEALDTCALLPGDDARRLRAELLAGEARMRGGDPEAAREHLDRAARLARSLGDVAALAQAAFFRAADRVPTPTEDPAAFDLLAEANDALGDEDTERKVRLLDLLSLAQYQDDAPSAVALADEALERAERWGHPQLLALACHGRAMARAGPDDVEERLALTARGIDAAKRARDDESVIVGRILRVMALLELGRIVDADHELDLAVGLAERRREPRFVWMARGWQGLRALRRGGLGDAERHYTEGLAVWQGRPTADAVVANGIQVVALRLLQGRAAEVLPLVQAAGTDRGGAHTWLAVRSLTAALAGDDDDARRSLAECLASSPERWPRDLTWAISASCAAEAAWLLGEPAAAAALAPLIEPMRDRHVVLTALGTGGSYWGCLAHPCGLLADLAGDAGRARALLEQALAEHQRIDTPPFVERSARALAEL